jgi:GH15 family glucan-1,4-alpha-glucosidase
MPSVGAEEVEIFSMFKPEGVEQLEKNTIKVIEKELFNGNYLPIRYKFFGKYRNIIDNYFQRGSWFHLGLQYAMYLIKKGEKEPAENIINYVETRIGDDGSLPEQEIYDEYKVNDPNGFFEKNGNSTIKCLLWAETAYLAAVSNFIN